MVQILYKNNLLENYKLLYNNSSNILDKLEMKGVSKHE
jgi:hypothetical protein